MNKEMTGQPRLFCRNYKLAAKRLEKKKQRSLDKARVIIEDLRKNRNWSWYRELRYRNENNLDSVALLYRGIEISYRKMFSNMEAYAKALKAYGLGKGKEIPICMSNTPEFVYLLGAVSMIGAVANIFGADFEINYIGEIIENCDSDILFVEDNNYTKISQIIATTQIKKVVMTSLSDSFIGGKDKYESYDRPYAELFTSKVHKYKTVKVDSQEENTSSEALYIMGIDDFVKNGKDCTEELVGDVNLDDKFTVTYSSGTTSNTPKPIIHAVRSFNVISRFHDPEVNHTPSYKMFTMQVAIPTYSSTGLISGISDALTQGSKLALEPIYDPKFVVDSLIINRPSYLDYTRSFWIRFAKEILYNPKYEGIKFPELFACFSVGEPTELGEEKLINRALKKVKAGRKLIPLPFPIVKLSIAGGDCEHGGIFYRLFRSYHNHNLLHIFSREPAGVGTFDLVDVSISDEEGNHCVPYQMGRLVATSELDMMEYKNNRVATQRFRITDCNGKEYGDCFVDAYQDSSGYFHLKGRRGNGDSRPLYKISDCILRDYKRVLSCEIIENNGHYIVHVEFQPYIRDPQAALMLIDRKCKKILGKEISSKIVYRIHGFQESFALTHSGKRDKSAIKLDKSGSYVKVVYRNGSSVIESWNGVESI